MISVFDVYSLVLLIASMSLFVHRYVKQNPPVYPYLIIACTCLVANWLGDLGGGIFALALLVSASFSFLGCLLYPSWRHMGQPLDNSKTRSANS